MLLRAMLGVTLALVLRAQTPAFDVASVKPEQITGDLYTANLGRILHGQLTMTNVTLSEAVRFAWGINNDAQVAGPDWIKDKAIRFKIDAKAPADTAREQVLLMLQGLLTERFRLRIHTEQREISHLELVPGRKELKIHPAEPGADASHNRNLYGHIISSGMSMEVLTTILSRFLREPILDRTGLEGPYTIDLNWAPEPRTPGEPPADSAAGPSIYAAVQQQLGLRLESRKTHLPVIVVDFAERVPIEN
ncbi:MAG TPA: TIGR03435 family protein [Verrucomicrobiae bacterium]|nr:TIGR03435 family protein [Verrucomicrobiae bacterium]